VASCAISCNDDAGIMLLRTATGKSERGFFYSLNAMPLSGAPGPSRRSTTTLLGVSA
jgi:hypothetical protein